MRITSAQAEQAGTALIARAGEHIRHKLFAYARADLTLADELLPKDSMHRGWLTRMLINIPKENQS